jgi:hypothetical protein
MRAHLGHSFAAPLATRPRPRTEVCGQALCGGTKHMAAEAPPSWWLLGPSCWKSINDQPVATSEALARLLAPPSQPLAPAAAAVTHTPAVVPAAPADAVLLRQRLEPPKFDVHEHSLRSERRRGIALRRREDIERKMHQEQMAEVQARQRVLAEAQAAQIAAREAELRTAAEEAEKAAASSSSKKQKKEEAAAASASKRKSVAPLARVEVALNEDEMASWYQASIQQETKTRAKVKLLVLPQARPARVERDERQSLYGSARLRAAPAGGAFGRRPAAKARAEDVRDRG